MKPKRLWSPSGFHAEKMTVRTRVPWYWRGMALAVIGAIVVALIGWFFTTGQKNAGFDRQAFTRQLNEANAVVQRISEENVQLKSSMEVFQRQAQIDKAAQRELSKSIHQLQEENAHLQEEVKFFRSIMSPGKAREGLSVQNFRIEPDALPNEYRFQVLLVQGGPRERDFVGKAQLTISLLKNGVVTVRTLPDDEKTASVFNINLKYYQRLEGSFKVEPGMVVKSVQLRVTDKSTGQVRLNRSLSFS